MRNALSEHTTALALAAHAAFSCVAPPDAYAQSRGDEITSPAVIVSDSPPLTSTQTQPYAGGQVARGGRLGLLGNADFLDTPFNQTSYTADLIEDQQARNLTDLLEVDPSVRTSTAPTNFQEYFSIRGFMFGAQDVAFNGMYGLTPYLRPPLEIAERVEVLKGSSAMLNGMPLNGSVSGTVNLVPKRAATTPLTRLSTQYISDSQLGAHLDIGRRFGESDSFGTRMNAAYRTGDSTIDNQEQTEAMLSLALDYQFDNVRSFLDILYLNRETNNPVRQFATDPTLSEVPATPGTGLSYPGYGQVTSEDMMATGRIEFDVSESLTVYAAMGRRIHQTDVIGTTVLLLYSGGNYASLPGWQIVDVDTKSYAAGANARFDTGSIKHRVAASITLVEEDQDTFLQSPIGALRVNNLYDPVEQGLPSTTGITPVVGNYQDSTLTSYALADTVSFLDERIQLTIGARHQSVEVQAYDPSTHLPAGGKYDESVVTPLIGLLAKPSPSLSLYANYSEDLAKGPSALPPAVTVATVLPPIRTKQMEVGSKYDWGEFAATFSAFQIERPSATADGGVLAENGEQRNRGIELNGFGEIASNLRMLGGVTFMQGELTKTAGGTFDGKEAIGVPRIQASLGADWVNVLAPGFSLSAQITHTGSQYVDQANRLEVPSWTRLDAGLRYVTRATHNPVTFRLSVENVFNRSWWLSSSAFANNDAFGGFLSLSTGRTVMLSLTTDFDSHN